MQDYKPIAFYNAIAMTVARTSNRVFVGESLGKMKSSPVARDCLNDELCQKQPTVHTFRMRPTMRRQWLFLPRYFV